MNRPHHFEVSIIINKSLSLSLSSRNTGKEKTTIIIIHIRHSRHKRAEKCWRLLFVFIAEAHRKPTVLCLCNASDRRDNARVAIWRCNESCRMIKMRASNALAFAEHVRFSHVCVNCASWMSVGCTLHFLLHHLTAKSCSCKCWMVYVRGCRYEFNCCCCFCCGTHSLTFTN